MNAARRAVIIAYWKGIPVIVYRLRNSPVGPPAANPFPVPVHFLYVHSLGAEWLGVRAAHYPGVDRHAKIYFHPVRYVPGLTPYAWHGRPVVGHGGPDGHVVWLARVGLYTFESASWWRGRNGY